MACLSLLGESANPLAAELGLSQELRMKIDTRPATVADTGFARDVHHTAYHDIVVRQFGPWDEEDQDRRFLADWKDASFVIIQRDSVDCG